MCCIWPLRPGPLRDRGDNGPQVTEEQPAARRLPLQQELRAAPHPQGQRDQALGHRAPGSLQLRPAAPPGAPVRLHQEAAASGQIKLYFPLFYFEIQSVPGIQLHLMGRTQQRRMPEAKAFWMLQIMEEMRPFLSDHVRRPRPDAGQRAGGLGGGDAGGAAATQLSGALPPERAFLRSAGLLRIWRAAPRGPSLVTRVSR